MKHHAMYRCICLVLVGAAAVMSTAAGASAASPSQAQQPLPTEPVVVVESFLAARNARDPLGATEWVASVLALQDLGGQRLVDGWTTSDWLRQLTDTYLLDTMTPLLADGETVRWTERLTPRAMRFPESLSNSMTVEVQAVIQDGRIASLSAPYPPLPARSPAVIVAVQGSRS